MEYKVRGDRVVIEDTEDFVPELIFECGQCFRWIRQAGGEWLGVAKGKVLEVGSGDDGIYFKCSEKEFIDIWYDYFDLDRNYAEIRRDLAADEFAYKAAEFGKGIRVLRQDPWETLCTFIISQCNNIKRIRSIVERMCSLFGEPVDHLGGKLYLFPEAERLAALELEDFEPLRAGYRSAYLLNAAKAVAAGDLVPDDIFGLPTAEAIKELTSLRGVGVKVANCVALFGFGKTDAFPVDVWIGRALEKYYGDKKFDVAVFGETAGIVQQYIFHYIRNGVE